MAKILKSQSDKPWSLEDSRQYLQKMLKDKQKHIQILGLFGILKGYHFANYDQLQYYIKRYTRAARDLTPFELEHIENVIKYLKESANYKIGLETVAKFVLEDIAKLSGDEPIIVLQNDGEAVHTVKRLRELESAGKIRWNPYTTKWEEIK